MGRQQMPAYSDQLTGAHEERLQRLEVGMQEVVTSTATTGLKIDHLAEKVDQGFQSLNERLDKGEKRFDRNEAVLAENKTDISRLSAVEEARTNRWSSVKKAALPLLAAGAGVLVTKGGETLWTWLTHLIR